MKLVQLDGRGRVVEFIPTENAIPRLRQRFAGVKFDVTTPSGMRDAEAARDELLNNMAELERRRQQLKAPLLEACKVIDSEYRRIMAALLRLEEPIHQQIHDEQWRKWNKARARKTTNP